MLSVYAGCFYKEEKRYAIIIPDLDYISVYGNTQEEALATAKEGMAYHLLGLSCEGKHLPMTSNANSINAYQIAKRFGITPQSVFVDMISVDVMEYVEKDAYLMYAAKNSQGNNLDWLFREKCRAREDFEAHERYVQKRLAEQEQLLAEQETRIRELETLIRKQE